jgi:hypothetical protein
MPLRTMTTLAAAALWILLGCTQRTMTLTLPRAAATGEAVHLHLVAGVLPRGARVVVRLPNGQIAGTATRYGGRTDQPAGEYIIPLPPEAIRNGKVTLRVEVEEDGTAREPKSGEVRKLELVYVPVTS